MSEKRLEGIAPLVEAAIQAKKIPGAVVLIGHEGQVVYRKAFGERSLVPERRPMTVDTIFDLASMTKVVATTTAVMQLVEQGKIVLSAPVERLLAGIQAKRQRAGHHPGTDDALFRPAPGPGTETRLDGL